MMGRLVGREPLFSEFRLDEHVPADHPLRRVDAALDLSFVRPLPAPRYSGPGRPSVDPELMLRMLLVGYLHGIRSERRLCDEVHLNLAYRWFCRLGLGGAVPDHSTFTKNRHGRFRGGGLFRRLFEEVVARCLKAGLVHGQDAAVDASVVAADASPGRRRPGDAPPESWGDRDGAARPVREYLEALDAALPPARDEPRPGEPKYLSETDPQAAWSDKHGPGEFAYSTDYLIDSETGVILDVEASPARFAAEVATARTTVGRTRERFGLAPRRLAADKAYGGAPLLAWLWGQGVEPHIPVLERHRQTGGKLTRDAFTYDPASDSFTCPGGGRPTYRGMGHATRVRVYDARPADCAACPLRPACTDAPARRLTRLVDEEARERVRALAGTHAGIRAVTPTA
jgi:transposase